MANTTIIGCVNPSTGDIIFEGDACDSGDYTGCIVTSGEHIGQVAIVVEEDNCDDTYYGCFDVNTGQFQVEIPDDCCVVAANCGYCSSGTPYRIRLTFSNITVCEDCIEANAGSCQNGSVRSYWLEFLNNVNADFVLTQVNNYPCQWEYYDDDFLSQNRFIDTECGTRCTDDPYFRYIRIRATRTASNIVVTFGGDFYIFASSGTPQAKCVEGTYDNMYAHNNCTEAIAARHWAYGGQVSLVEL